MQNLWHLSRRTLLQRLISYPDGVRELRDRTPTSLLRSGRIEEVFLSELLLLLKKIGWKRIFGWNSTVNRIGRTETWRYKNKFRELKKTVSLFLIRLAGESGTSERDNFRHLDQALTTEKLVPSNRFNFDFFQGIYIIWSFRNTASLSKVHSLNLSDSFHCISVYLGGMQISHCPLKVNYLVVIFNRLNQF